MSFTFYEQKGLNLNVKKIKKIHIFNTCSFFVVATIVENKIFKIFRSYFILECGFSVV